MQTFKDIISLWPSVGDFAADIGVPDKTAAQMKWRNSVNSKHWKQMCDGASRRGIDGVTLERLAEIKSAAA